jgi:DNA helicase-2/ATP-dependent DNA helicase PcrA
METKRISSGPKWLESLNNEQRTATKHDAGPLLVIAGAGTGKTKTVAARVANLIAGGADPSRILLLTFTRRAAEEMIRRAGRVVGESAAKQVQGGTFHSMANRLLRSHGESLGLGKNFVIMDQGDAEDLLHLIRTDLGMEKSETRFPKKGALSAIYSRCINAGEPLDQVLTERFPWCSSHKDGIKQIFQSYGTRKAERNLVDYDDLLLYWDQALDFPGVGEAIVKRFQHVLVDEYQDTNPLQGAILRKMWALMRKADCQARIESDSPAASCSIMVVGDDAQSIYSFRGATVQNILNFPEQFPGTTKVTLEQNYRSVMPILDAANAVMEGARERFTKSLWSDRKSQQRPHLVTCENEIQQSTFVADRILEHREEGVRLTRQAVLFRAGHNSDALEVELSRRNIPFVKWGGLKFLEAAHIKDLLAFLRILENPNDDLSWMRLLQMLDGIGPTRARQIAQHILDNQGRFRTLLTWKAPADAREQLRGMAALFQELADPKRDVPLPVQIERIRQFYIPLFEERYDNPEVRLRDLDQLQLLAQQAPSRSSFLADLTLDPPVSTGDFAGHPLLDEDHVILSTIHSAKGCQWDVVYLIHAADGVIPSDMAKGPAEVEEERRLLYVAMTRPRNRLYLTFPLRYYHRKHELGDNYSTAQLSRFLTPRVLSLLERTSFSGAQATECPEPAVCLAASANVRARVSRLWE